jgi:hypothetical protein
MVKKTNRIPPTERIKIIRVAVVLFLFGLRYVKDGAVSMGSLLLGAVRC